MHEGWLEAYSITQGYCIYTYVQYILEVNLVIAEKQNYTSLRNMEKPKVLLDLWPNITFDLVLIF